MKILLGPEYVSDEEEPDSEEESEGEQEDARDTFVDRTTVPKTHCDAFFSSIGPRQRHSSVTPFLTSVGRRIESIWTMISPPGSKRHHALPRV